MVPQMFDEVSIGDAATRGRTGIVKIFVGHVYVGLFFCVYQAQFSKLLEIQRKFTCQKV